VRASATPAPAACSLGVKPCLAPPSPADAGHRSEMPAFVANRCFASAAGTATYAACCHAAPGRLPGSPRCSPPTGCAAPPASDRHRQRTRRRSRPGGVPPSRAADRHAPLTGHSDPGGLSQPEAGTWPPARILLSATRCRGSKSIAGLAHASSLNTVLNAVSQHALLPPLACRGVSLGHFRDEGSSTSPRRPRPRSARQRFLPALLDCATRSPGGLMRTSTAAVGSDRVHFAEVCSRTVSFFPARPGGPGPRFAGRPCRQDRALVRGGPDARALR